MAAENPTPQLVSETLAPPPLLKDPALQQLRDEVFDVLSTVRDPEHPYTLVQLGVVREADIEVSTRGPPAPGDNIVIRLTPTVPHCSLIATISLCVRRRLEDVFGADRMRTTKLRLVITPGAHLQAKETERQINDKERVAAALDNPHLLEVVERLVAED